MSQALPNRMAKSMTAGASQALSDHTGVYVRPWFEWLVLSLVVLSLLVLLHQNWLTSQSDGQFSNQVKLFPYFQSAVHFWQHQTLSALNLSQERILYPLLLSFWFQWSEAEGVQKAFQIAHHLNLYFYGASCLLMFLWVSPKLKKPYALLVSIVFAVSPWLIQNVQALNGLLFYNFLNLSTLLLFEKTLGKDAPLPTVFTLFLNCLMVSCCVLAHPVFWVLFPVLGVLIYRKNGISSAAISLLGILGLLACLMILWSVQGVLPASVILTHLSNWGQAFSGAAENGFQTWGNQSWSHQQAVMTVAGELPDKATVLMTSPALTHFLSYSYPVDSVMRQCQTGLYWLLVSMLSVGLLVGILSVHRRARLASGYLLLLLGVYAFCRESFDAVLILLPLMLLLFFMGLMSVGMLFKKIRLPLTRIVSPLISLLLLLSSFSFIYEHFMGNTGHLGEGMFKTELYGEPVSTLALEDTN